MVLHTCPEASIRPQQLFIDSETTIKTTVHISMFDIGCQMKEPQVRSRGIFGFYSLIKNNFKCLVTRAPALVRHAQSKVRLEALPPDSPHSTWSLLTVPTHAVTTAAYAVTPHNTFFLYKVQQLTRNKANAGRGLRDCILYCILTCCDDLGVKLK